jgi:STE24 endopeptidase
MDQFKSFLISALISLLLIPILFIAINTLNFWWVYAWLGGTVFTIFISYIAPTVLMPVFYQFEELEDSELSNRLRDLADKAGIDIVGSYKMGAEEKTKKAVGGLTGMGSTRRIILSDTLLDNYSKDEIETVIAHELGHHVNNDVWKGIIRNSLMMLVGLFVVNISLPEISNFFGVEPGIASLPLFSVIIGIVFFIISPIENTISRIQERKADRFALELTGKPDAAANSFLKLSKQNLSNAAPHPLVEFLFHDHPSSLKRVKRAKNYDG